MRKLKPNYISKVYRALRLLHHKPQTAPQLAELVGVDKQTLTKTLAEFQRHGIVCVVSFVSCGGSQSRTYALGQYSIDGATLPPYRPSVTDVMMRMLVKSLMSGFGYTFDELVEETGLAKATVMEHVLAIRAAGLCYRRCPSYLSGTRAHQHYWGVDRRDKRAKALTGAERTARYRERVRLQKSTTGGLPQAAGPQTGAVHLLVSKPNSEASDAVSSKRRSRNVIRGSTRLAAEPAPERSPGPSDAAE